ncbi:MAG TPA: hypothetical protein PK957_00205 [Candidatus Dojkabacteria bacterium]|nr:hypothetical protein [Candidatus Dojkabacteria bacterium]HQF36160.1 hypothetical protein [Candidatus Dojkabacteria bacterium]
MKIKLTIFLFTLFIFCTSFLFFKEVKAEYQIPSCGVSYDSSIQLQEGENIKSDIAEGESCYFYINSKPGFEIKIDYRITGDFFGSVSMYDSERQGAVSSIDKEDTLRWLGNELEESKYYLVINNSYTTDSILLTVSLIDRTDANNGTDAGGNYDSAMNIQYGEYTGYLSGFTYGEVGGNDDADYYKISVKSGDKVIVRVSPVGEYKIGNAVYDSNRAELLNEDGLDLDAGQIIQNTFNIKSNGYIYVVVEQAMYGTSFDSIDQYKLLISNESVENLGGEVDGETDDSTGKEIDVGVPSNTKDIIIKLSIVALVIFVIILVVLIVIRLTKKIKEAPQKKDTVTPDDNKVEGSSSNSFPTNSSNNDDQKDSNKVKITVEEGTEVEVNTVESEKKED